MYVPRSAPASLRSAAECPDARRKALKTEEQSWRVLVNFHVSCLRERLLSAFATILVHSDIRR